MRNLCKVLSAGIFAVIGSLFLSCTSEAPHNLDVKLDTAISDSIEVVFTGDIKMLFEQTDITVKNGHVKLPEYIANIFGGSVMTTHDSNDMTMSKILDTLDGVEYDDVVLAFNAEKVEGLEGMLVFGLTDKKDFINSLKKIDPDLREGMAQDFVTIGHGGHHILIKDNLAYCAFNDYGELMPDEAARIIERWNRYAETAPLAAWKKDYLTQKRVMNGLISVSTITSSTDHLMKHSVMAQFNSLSPVDKDGYIGFGANLEGPSLKFFVSNFDKGGKICDTDMNGNFNTEMMRFASPDDIIAISWCLNQKGYEFIAQASANPSLKKNMQLAQPYAELSREIYGFLSRYGDVPAEYLSEGGVFVAGGLASDFSLTDFLKPSAYHFVLAADLKPGKAEAAYAGIVKNINSLLSDSPARYSLSNVTLNGISQKAVSIPYVSDYDNMAGISATSNLECYVALVGNILVVSNKPVCRYESNPFSKDIFSGKMMAAQVILPATSPIMEIAGIKTGFEIWSESDGTTGELVISFPDTDRKFIPELFGLLSSYDI